MTPSTMITAVFTVAYLAVTAWLCRGLRLNTRSVCYGGLTCAATLVLGSFLLYLPTGAAISPGSWIPLMLLALTYDWRLACVTVLCGVLLAILLRFIGQMLSGVVFFSQNAWDGWGAWGYSITYHLSCKIPEGTATTLIMLALPLKTIQNAIGGKQS